MSQPAIRRCRNWKRPVDLDAVGSATASLHSLVALHSPLGDSGVCGRHFACFGRLRDPTGSGMRRLRVGKFRISSAAFASHHARRCRPLVPIARSKVLLGLSSGYRPQDDLAAGRRPFAKSRKPPQYGDFRGFLPVAGNRRQQGCAVVESDRGRLWYSVGTPGTSIEARAVAP